MNEQEICIETQSQNLTDSEKPKQTRKYFIDNIRWLCILLLFPFHTFRVFNIGEEFYVKGATFGFAGNFIEATEPWFMPLLFIIAGISSAYSLKKRSYKEYIKERIFKLLIPLIVGVLILVPIQTYFAEKFHNGYTGGYFEQYVLFFTKPTDLTGYTGGFTPAHLWFILYLFIISMAALPVFIICRKIKWQLKPEKTPLWLLLIMFVIPWLMTPVLNIGGTSFGLYFALFMLGYYFLSNEELLKKFDKYRFTLIIVAIAGMAGYLLLYYFGQNETFIAPDIFYDIYQSAYGWIMILAILGLGGHYLNFRNKTTDYLSKSSFPVYIFHQTVLVAVAYYILLLTANTILQVILIMLLSLLFTYALYEIFRRIPKVGFLFGIKTQQNQKSILNKNQKAFAEHDCQKYIVDKNQILNKGK